MEKESQQVEKKDEGNNNPNRNYFNQNFIIFFGYNGEAFHGLQRNPDVLTVEDSLEKALFEAKLITEDNFGDLSKLGWKRASRTDKGVHAAMNAVSCRLIILDEYLKDDIKEEDKKEGKGKLKFMMNRKKIVDVINSFIHKDLKVYGKKNN